MYEVAKGSASTTSLYAGPEALEPAEQLGP